MAARSHLSIGEVLSLLREEFSDITISKIRFLESQGLVDPERTPSGYRKFYDHDVERLRWILRQQKENFLPLKVIKGRLSEQDPDGLAAEDPTVWTGEIDVTEIDIIRRSTLNVGPPTAAASRVPAPARPAQRPTSPRAAGAAGPARTPTAAPAQPARPQQAVSDSAAGAAQPAATVPQRPASSGEVHFDSAADDGNQAAHVVDQDVFDFTAGASAGGAAAEGESESPASSELEDEQAAAIAPPAAETRVEPDSSPTLEAATNSAEPSGFNEVEPDAPTTRAEPTVGAIAVPTETAPEPASTEEPAARDGADVSPSAARGGASLDASQASPSPLTPTEQVHTPAEGPSPQSVQPTGSAAQFAASPAQTAVATVPSPTASEPAAPAPAAPSVSEPAAMAGLSAAVSEVVAKAEPIAQRPDSEVEAAVRQAASSPVEVAVPGSAPAEPASLSATAGGVPAAPAASAPMVSERPAEPPAEAPAAAPGTSRARASAAAAQPASVSDSEVDSFTPAELASAAGIEVEEVDALRSFGLLVPHADVAGTSYYDREALAIVKLAASFASHGVEARHLRAWKTAADREAGLFEQLIVPLLRQRNPTARRQATDTLDQLAVLGGELRDVLVRQALRHLR